MRACLNKLSHGELLAIAAKGCEASGDVQKFAESFVSLGLGDAAASVMSSTDLVPHLLARLGPCGPSDGGAATVCKLWWKAWLDTREFRRYLMKVNSVPLITPFSLIHAWDDEAPVPSVSMAVVSGDATHHDFLVMRYGNKVSIIESDMTCSSWFPVEYDSGDIAASRDSIWVVNHYFKENDGHFEEISNIERRTLEGNIEEQTEVFDEENNFRRIAYPVVASNKIVFGVAFNEDPEEGEVITALDAKTLKCLLTFGRYSSEVSANQGELQELQDPHELVVVHNELFVCDTGSDKLQVYCHNGVHQRVIQGAWRRPKHLCFKTDRLYLIEQNASNSNCDKFIFVLSLKGETLQKVEVSPSTIATSYFPSPFCWLGETLLIPIRVMTKHGYLTLEKFEPQTLKYHL